MSDVNVNAELQSYVSRKDGTSQVVISISYNSRKYRKPTSIKVRPDQLKDGKIVNHVKAKNYNSVISAYISEYELAVLDMKRKGTLNIYEIKKLIGKSEKRNSFLFDFIESQIDILSPYRTAETIRNYGSQLRKLKEFYPSPIQLTEIDNKFLSRYKDWMIQIGNTTNGIWSSEKFLRSMLQRAVPEYIKCNPYEGFERTKYQETIPRFLYPDEVKAIEGLVMNLGESDLKRAGMYFLADIEMGLRVSDLMNLDTTIDVKNGRLTKFTKKGKSIVSFKLTDKMKSYYGYIKDRPFNFSETMYDKHLKTLGRLAGIKTVLSSHVARHTLGRRLAAAGINIGIAQKILGHRNVKSTERYYHITDKEVDSAMDKLNGR